MECRRFIKNTYLYTFESIKIILRLYKIQISGLCEPFLAWLHTSANCFMDPILMTRRMDRRDEWARVEGRSDYLDMYHKVVW